MFKGAFFKVTILTKMANMVTLASIENFKYNSKRGGGGGAGKEEIWQKRLNENCDYLSPWKVACEQALRGALAAGREKEGELAIKSLEF